MLDRLKKQQTSFTHQLSTTRLNLHELEQGLSVFESFFVWRNGDQIKAYDRICDHNGGRLVHKDNKIQCPMHGWEFDPESGSYINVECRKAALTVINQNNQHGTLEIQVSEKKRRLNAFTAQYQVQMRFLNHACLLFSSDVVSFATDPWIIGPAFSNGWWLAMASPSDSFEQLNQCDFIYISHNHPDHLHPESLSYIRKDMPFLIAPFASGSTEKYLRELGFNNIYAGGFDEELIDKDKQISFSVLKSGDFRDDSGLLLQIGEFSALLNVDSNHIDFWRFPDEICLLGTSFAGGASGFPLCFNNYSEQEKLDITTRNRRVIRQINLSMIDKAKPKYFMPYAGFFTEKAARDSYIKQNNVKNDIGTFFEPCMKRKVDLLDVAGCDSYTFKGELLIERKSLNKARLFEQTSDKYIETTRNKYAKITEQEIAHYFCHSGFKGNLYLHMSLTDDEFKSLGQDFLVEFDPVSEVKVSFDMQLPPEVASGNLKNYLHIKVRREEFVRVLKEALPWEDLSIGFQCRVEREPNIYNSDFWYHFTNHYIKSAVPEFSQ